MAAVVAIWQRLLSWFLFRDSLTPAKSHGIADSLKELWDSKKKEEVKQRREDWE